MRRRPDLVCIVRFGFAGASARLIRNGEDFGYQVAALREAGYRAILVDNRGRGRSTRGTGPFTYERMASEVLTVIDELELEEAAIVGWSDGALIGLILAMHHPDTPIRLHAGCAWITLLQNAS